ncbi:MAG TPA: class I SAM-dependent methyltransferase [Pseudolabrys sp.]|nr:class I SAM-dependent methyltransferase [Pseudolabrys sp.]
MSNGARVAILLSMSTFADLIISHYERHAFAWDAERARNAWNDKPWHDRFIQMLPRDAAVLDVGCGSGFPVAQHMAAHGVRITGVDSSPTLISLCRTRLPEHDWIVGDMRTLSLKQSFHGILAWDSFFHLNHRDQRQMFDVFAAHAAPGAVLMFNAGPQFGEAIGNFRGDPLYHASLDAGEYAGLLHKIGFEIVSHVVEDSGAGGRTVWLASSRNGFIRQESALRERSVR